MSATKLISILSVLLILYIGIDLKAKSVHLSQFHDEYQYEPIHYDMKSPQPQQQQQVNPTKEGSLPDPQLLLKEFASKSQKELQDRIDVIQKLIDENHLIEKQNHGTTTQAEYLMLRKLSIENALLYNELLNRQLEG